MDKSRIIRYLVDSVDYSKEEISLIGAIEEARQEMENARAFFDLVSEPRLIDCAIYMEEAAKARFTYLLSEAKKLNVTMDCSYTLGDVSGI